MMGDTERVLGDVTYVDVQICSTASLKIFVKALWVSNYWFLVMT